MGNKSQIWRANSDRVRFYRNGLAVAGLKKVFTISSQPKGLWRLDMKINMQFIRSSFLALILMTLPIFVAAGEKDAADDTLSDTLVVVEKIVGVDAEGNKHTLYSEEDGRVYRLGNIEQAIHDMNARGIEAKGTFWSLQAVLSDTVYLMGNNSNPQPTQRAETKIPESLSLSVDNLRVTKDRVIAVYSTNCDNTSI